MSKDLRNFFPISVWYGEGKARAPMMPRFKTENSIMAKRDIEAIKDLGFNTIRTWVDWAGTEPKKDIWNFETIDDVLAISKENDLKVVVQIYTDSAPNWLINAFPDGRFISQGDNKLYSQASPGFCLDNPGVRKEAEKFLISLAAHVKDHKAFYAWDVWSEPHVVQWSWLDYLINPVWFCYCKCSKERFRKWLKKKYHDINNLNIAWYRTYSDWEEIQPPRYVTLSTFKDLLDWQMFNVEKLQEDLRWRYKTIKSVDPIHLISSHSDISSVYTNPMGGYGSPDDWKMAKEVDLWGTSFYPKHTGGMMPLDPAEKGTAIDATRCAANSNGKNFWIGELQGGHGVTGFDFGEPVTANDIELWAWTAVARNAKGLNYYAWYPMSCGYEISGFGLVNMDGTITDRAKSAGNVAKIISKNQSLFLNAKPYRSQVAILYNIYSYMMSTCLRATTKSKNMFRSSLIGIYRAMFEENVQTDFIHAKDTIRKKMDDYKLIFLPLSIMMNEKIASKLKEFVYNGGKLVAEFRPGWSNDNGICSDIIPGFGLDEVFGCKERWTYQTDNISLKISKMDSSIPFLSLNDDLKGCEYEELLIPTTGKVIAEFSDGNPIIIVDKYGRGEAVLIGTLLGASYYKYHEENAAKMIKGFLKWADVERTVRIQGTKNVEVRLLARNDDTLLFIFNHNNYALSPTICLTQFTNDHIIHGLSKKKEVIYGKNNNRLTFTLSLKSNEVWVATVNTR